MDYMMILPLATASAITAKTKSENNDYILELSSNATSPSSTTTIEADKGWFLTNYIGSGFRVFFSWFSDVKQAWKFYWWPSTKIIIITTPNVAIELFQYTGDSLPPSLPKVYLQAIVQAIVVQTSEPTDQPSSSRPSMHPSTQPSSQQPSLQPSQQPTMLPSQAQPTTRQSSYHRMKSNGIELSPSGSLLPNLPPVPADRGIPIPMRATQDIKKMSSLTDNTDTYNQLIDQRLYEQGLSSPSITPSMQPTTTTELATYETLLDATLTATTATSAAALVASTAAGECDTVHPLTHVVTPILIL